MGARPKIVAPPQFAQRPERFKPDDLQPTIQFAEDESKGSRQFFKPTAAKTGT